MNQGGDVATAMVILIVGFLIFAMGGTLAYQEWNEDRAEIKEQVFGDMNADISSLKEMLGKFVKENAEIKVDLSIANTRLEQIESAKSVIPERPSLIPTQVSVNSKETVTVRFDEPVKIEIIESYRPPKVMPKPVKVRKPAVKKKVKGK